MPTCTISYVAGWAVLLLSLPIAVQGAVPVQFIDGLWLDRETIHPQETVRVYVALRNSASVAISGTVAIKVDGKLLDSRAIAALPGRLIESWVDWTPEATGDYRITATLKDVTLEHSEGSERIPEHTATLTRDAVAVTAPPTPPSTTPTHNGAATATPNTALTQYLPQWYQSFHDQIQQAHDGLQAYETILTNRQTVTNITPRPHATHTPATTTAAINLERAAHGTTTAGATISGIITEWFSTNLQAARLWLIRSVRWLFGYPVVVQLLLLVSILWATYRIASYFGKR